MLPDLRCRYCLKAKDQHVGEQCLFDHTRYEAISPITYGSTGSLTYVLHGQATSTGTIYTIPALAPEPVRSERAGYRTPPKNPRKRTRASRAR